MKEKCYRHELKFNISYGDYLAIRQRLKPIMKQDSHVNKDGCYLVKSIYFDNFEDKALREKVEGYAKREKFRIRYYDNDLSYISLEKKMKNNSLSMKLDTGLSEDEVRRLLQGDILWMKMHPQGLIQELYVKMRYQMLRPKVVVSYVREPYIFKAGNVRICFDSQISSSLLKPDFLAQNNHEIPVLETTKSRILEIKYDHFLPDIIRNIVQLENCRQEAFSKYGSCRKFG